MYICFIIASKVFFSQKRFTHREPSLWNYLSKEEGKWERKVWKAGNAEQRQKQKADIKKLWHGRQEVVLVAIAVAIEWCYLLHDIRWYRNVQCVFSWVEAAGIYYIGYYTLKIITQKMVWRVQRVENVHAFCLHVLSNCATCTWSCN